MCGLLARSVGSVPIVILKRLHRPITSTRLRFTILVIFFSLDEVNSARNIITVVASGVVRTIPDPAYFHRMVIGLYDIVIGAHIYTLKRREIMNSATPAGLIIHGSINFTFCLTKNREPLCKTEWNSVVPKMSFTPFFKVLWCAWFQRRKISQSTYHGGNLLEEMSSPNHKLII